MIVNNTNKGWEIIFQRAHGLLAAEIAQYWQVGERPKKWMETLAAICEHDDSQQTWHDTHHLTEHGTPQDFTLQPPDFTQAKRVTEAAKLKSSWVALLISKHISRLYGECSGINETWKAFLDEQARFRDEMLKISNINSEVLDKAYKLMYWCDRAAL